MIYHTMSDFEQSGNYNYAILTLYVDAEDAELRALYQEQAAKHNQAVQEDPFPNAGFDLFFPKSETFGMVAAKFVDLRVKCMMRHYDLVSKEWTPTAFYVYPRSSMSKTPLMLANHMGIIDSGYRGFLIGAFRHLRESLASPDYEVAKHTRLLQICSSDMRPILVELVDREDAFATTSRGSGGFGSTGLYAS